MKKGFIIKLGYNARRHWLKEHALCAECIVELYKHARIFKSREKCGEARAETCITVKIHSNYDGVRVTTIMLRSIAASLI